MIIYNSVALLQIPRVTSTTIQKLALDKRTEGADVLIDNPTMYKTYQEGIQSGNATADMAVICVSRNPYDRIFSMFMYRHMRMHDRSRMRMRSAPSARAIRMFQNFVLNGGLEIFFQSHRGFWAMKTFTDGIPEGKLQIVHLEDESAYHQTMNSYFGLPAESDIPVMRKLLGLPSYIEYYTPEMVEIVNRVYLQDFEKFGYTMLAPESVA